MTKRTWKGSSSSPEGLQNIMKSRSWWWRKHERTEDETTYRMKPEKLFYTFRAKVSSSINHSLKKFGVKKKEQVISEASTCIFFLTVLLSFFYFVLFGDACVQSVFLSLYLFWIVLSSIKQVKAKRDKKTRQEQLAHSVASLVWWCKGSLSARLRQWDRLLIQ